MSLNPIQPIGEPAGDWWADWFSVPGVTALGAYQSKSAPTYENSKTNIANPGVYDLTGGTSTPEDVAWTAENGWEFDGYLHRTLRSLPATNVRSMIYRFSGLSNVGAMGASDGAPAFVVQHDNADHFVLYDHGSVQYQTGAATKINTGIVAIAGENFYINKTLAKSGMTFTGAETLDLGVGCQVISPTTNINRIVGYIQAVAYYDGDISSNITEFEALVDRINAL